MTDCLPALADLADRRLGRHSDRGSQFLSLQCTTRLEEASVLTSVGSRGASYDNTLAERISRLSKAEVVHRKRVWRRCQEVDMATLECVHRYNNERLLGSLGYLPPAEAEVDYHR